MLGGWARALVRDARNELVGGGGLSVNREKPVEGESTTNLEAAAGFDYSNFASDFPNTDIHVNAMGYLRELRQRARHGGRAEERQGLTLTLGYSF